MTSKYRPGSDLGAGAATTLLCSAVLNLPFGLAITDHHRDGDPVVFVNKAFALALGSEADALLGKGWHALLGSLRERGTLEEIGEAVTNARPYGSVLAGVGTDDADRYHELRVSPLRTGSADVTHMLWLLTEVTGHHDQTERLTALIAEKEDRFRAYVQNASEAIWRIDFDPPIRLDDPRAKQVQEIFDNGIFTEANNASAHVYGLPDADDVIGRRIADFMDQSNPRNVQRMAELVDSQFHMRNVISHEARVDGTPRTIVNNITPATVEGTVHFIWGASLDVTELFEAQEKLTRSREELIAQSKVLEEKNMALRELIANVELDKKDFKDRVVANIEQVVLPSLDRLKGSKGEDVYFEQHRLALESLTSDFGRRVVNPRFNLTPREIEVCNLVKNGLSSKKIAGLLKIALHTVEKHRRTAREKLGLANKGINLRTYLNSL